MRSICFQKDTVTTHDCQRGTDDYKPTGSFQQLADGPLALLWNDFAKIHDSGLKLIRTAIDATNHGELLSPLRRDTSFAVRFYFDIIQVPMLGNIAVSFFKPMDKLFTAFSNLEY